MIVAGGREQHSLDLRPECGKTAGERGARADSPVRARDDTLVRLERVGASPGIFDRAKLDWLLPILPRTPGSIGS